MALPFSLLAFIVSRLITVLAAPPASFLRRQEADATGGISALTTPVIETFKPYTNFANAAYCAPIRTVSWSCGEPCEANPNFKPTAVGGDGVFVQFCEF